MTSQEAKQILLRYRPGTPDGSDADVTVALAQVESDPDLKRWFEEHCTFQDAVRDRLRHLPVPGPALALPKAVAGPAIWWLRPTTLAAAAAILLAAALAVVLWLQPEPTDRFEIYRARMARSVLREYRMDIETADMTQLRQFLRENGAPADYRVPGGLAPLPLSGGGVHKWRGEPVSMVCFDRGQRQMVFLFVVDRGAIRNPPPEAPQVERVSRLVTASWSEGTKAYLLATEAEDENVLRRYF